MWDVPGTRSIADTSEGLWILENNCIILLDQMRSEERQNATQARTENQKKITKNKPHQDRQYHQGD